RLVVVIDSQGVITTGRGGNAGSAEYPCRTAPGCLSNQIAAEYYGNTVIAVAGKTVFGTCLQIDQPAHLAGGSCRDGTATGCTVIDIAQCAAGAGSSGIVDSADQRSSGSAAAACATNVQVAPGLYLQVDAAAAQSIGRQAQARLVGDGGDIDDQAGTAAQIATIRWAEADMCVVRLLVADACSSKAVEARLMLIRGKAQLAGIDSGF